MTESVEDTATVKAKCERLQAEVQEYLRSEGFLIDEYGLAYDTPATRARAIARATLARASALTLRDFEETPPSRLRDLEEMPSVEPLRDTDNETGDIAEDIPKLNVCNEPLFEAPFQFETFLSQGGKKTDHRKLIDRRMHVYEEFLPYVPMGVRSWTTKRAKRAEAKRKRRAKNKAKSRKYKRVQRLYGNKAQRERLQKSYLAHLLYTHSMNVSRDIPGSMYSRFHVEHVHQRARCDHALLDKSSSSAPGISYPSMYATSSPATAPLRSEMGVWPLTQGDDPTALLHPVDVTNEDFKWPTWNFEETHRDLPSRVPVDAVADPDPGHAWTNDAIETAWEQIKSGNAAVSQAVSGKCDIEEVD